MEGKGGEKAFYHKFKDHLQRHSGSCCISPIPPLPPLCSHLGLKRNPGAEREGSTALMAVCVREIDVDGPDNGMFVWDLYSCVTDSAACVHAADWER